MSTTLNRRVILHHVVNLGDSNLTLTPFFPRNSSTARIILHLEWPACKPESDINGGELNPCTPWSVSFLSQARVYRDLHIFSPSSNIGYQLSFRYSPPIRNTLGFGNQCSFIQVGYRIYIYTPKVRSLLIYCKNGVDKSLLCNI